MDDVASLIVYYDDDFINGLDFKWVEHVPDHILEELIHILPEYVSCTLRGRDKTLTINNKLEALYLAQEYYKGNYPLLIGGDEYASV